MRTPARFASWGFTAYQRRNMTTFDSTDWLDSLSWLEPDSSALDEVLGALPGDDYYGPCGARCRDGHACKAHKVGGSTRCRMHGGLSTGPRTSEGIERIREANTRRWADYRLKKAATRPIDGQVLPE
jgi:hypothetical protein